MARKYCKAYYLKDIQQFSGWVEKRTEYASAIGEEDVVYLWDDFTVVKSPVVPEGDVLFDVVSPEWQEFCQTTLHFEVPEDLHYAYESADQQGEQVVEQQS